jgi:predicted kinase
MSNQLIILCGIPFSGKTTLANQLADLKGYLHIDLDAVKVKHIGSSQSDENISQSEWDQIYQLMYRQIESALISGQTVIHDTGNFTTQERGYVSAIATKLKLPFITIYVDTPIATAYARLQANRKKPSRFNITDEQFYAAAHEMAPPTTIEHAVVYHDSDNLSAWIAANLDK